MFFGFPSALFALFTLSVCPIAHAQHVWNVTFDQKDDTTQSYLPFIFASRGNYCTAVALAVRKTEEVFEFIRSNDGGLTWHEQWSVPEYDINNGYVFVFAMQQIDSLNVVAVGDSGNIFRTFDGGVTWSRQRIPEPFANTASLFGVHFHDPMNGIIGFPEWPYTTTNGGVTWVQGPYTGLGSWMCHCYGAGKFAVFNENTGVIHRTSNSWATMDSTDSIPNAASFHMDVRWTDWTDGDTIIGYGLDSGTAGCIVQTLDGGGTWFRPELRPSEGGITSISGISDDTLFAGRITTASNSILFSSDFGQTWDSDTISVMSQDSYYSISTINAIARPSPGVILAAVQQNPSWLSTGLIIRGTLSTAGVSIPAPNTFGIAQVYPNPASDQSIFVNFDYRLAPVRVIDCLGREVMRVAMPPAGTLELDISHLPKGIYYLIDDRERAKFVKE